MKPENELKISIPKPCHEDWNTMTPNEQGSFCGKCCKTVIDFSIKSTDEIKTILSEQSGKKVCGRFMSNQLDEKPEEEIKFEIPLHLFSKNLSYTKRFILALLLVFGTSLFSCNTNDGKLVGDIVITNKETDSSKTAVKLIDTNEVNNKTLLGDTVISIQPPQVMGQARVLEKCNLINGDVKVEHTKGEVVVMEDTVKTTIPKDTLVNYPKMGKLKFVPK